MNDFLLMLQFLTRIPINLSLKCEMQNFRRGALFLPIIGAIVGGIQWLAYILLIRLLPANIVAVIIFIISALLTGALHIDGLGDTCDGFYAFKGKERIIEIMKDSRIGTYACIAVVSDILLKIASYNYIIENKLAAIIILAPILGRMSLLFISLIGKPAKSTGSGNLFIGNMSKVIVFIAFLLTIAAAVFLTDIKQAIILIVAAVLVTILVNTYSRSKIGGITGDLLGANNELVELIILITFIALNGRI